MAHSICNLKVFKSKDGLYKAAVEYIIALARKSIATKGRFTISLSGGETPKKLYSLLSKLPFREQLQWNKTFIFWSDERCVALDDDRNNAHQAKLILINKVDIPISNIHFIPVNLSPVSAAAKYEKDLKRFFGKYAPRFDLVLLGLGENGHTASLFPGTKVIEEKAEGIRALYVEEEKMFRITMTAPLINLAHHILFLVSGKGKAGILNKVIKSTYQPNNYPAQLIKPVDGELNWFADNGSGLFLNNT